MISFVAFLRGINVGGNAIIKMDELAKVFSSLKFKNVRTFIASGNVLFESSETDAKKIEAKIEKALLKAFAMKISVMVRTIKEIDSIVAKHSFGKKTTDGNWKLYVVFLKDEAAAAGKKVLTGISGEMETYSVSNREVYCALHKNHPKPTFSGNFVEKHLKTAGTARNWNTINKILKMGSK